MFQASPGQKEVLETRVSQASRASLDSLVPLGRRESRDLEGKLVPVASWGRRVTRVRGAPWGSQALKDARAPKGSKDRREFQGPKACRALRVKRAPQGRPGPAAEWATLAWQASAERKARRASLESRDLRDSQESAENPATPAPAGMRAPPASRATPGSPDLEGWPETAAYQDSPGDRAWRAATPVTSTSWTW